MEKHEEVSRKPVKKIIVDNFIGGVAWGLGVTIGAAIIVALGGFILSQINLIPVVGELVREISEYVQNTSPDL